MKKISIIVPCYNCEKTINKTVESIQQNSYAENTEIFLVNDGSKDKTSEVLDKLSKKYSNVRVINKENTGVSETRNVGIDACTGDYITFVDSDDYIINNCYKKISDILEKEDFDILYFNFYEDIDGKLIKSKYKLDNKTINKEEFMNMFLLDKVSISSWDKIYKKTLLNNTKFNKNFTVGEDALFLINVINDTNKIRIINEYFYGYVQNEKSIVHSLNEKMIQPIKITNYIDDKIKKEHEDSYSFFEANLMLKCIHQISNNRTRKNHKEAVNLIKKVYDKNKLKQLLKSKNISKFSKLELIILKNFGISFHLKMFKIYKTIKQVLRKGD